MTVAIQYRKDWLSQVEPGRPFRMRKGVSMKDQLSRKKLNDEGEFYTPDEVAVRFKINVETVREKIRSRELKAYKVGRHYRISEAQIQEYLGAQK